MRDHTNGNINTVFQNLLVEEDARVLPPLVAGLVAHAGEGYLGFHMPGHHQGRAAWTPWRDLLGEAAFSLDLTELPGLDNLQDPQGIIREAAGAASAFFGAAETHFLVNGASAGILAVLLARCQEGGARSAPEGDLLPGAVLVPRNCHQSVVHGLILSGATPIYLPVHFHPGLGLPGLLQTEDLRSALNSFSGFRAEQPVNLLVNSQLPPVSPLGLPLNLAAGSPAEDVNCLLHSGAGHHPGSGNGETVDTAVPLKADLQARDRCLLVLLHPNYYGLAGDLAEQIRVAHQTGLLVLTDEAHGSHFCAGPLFPDPALAVGTDFTVMSAHKTLGAFTQAAWLHSRESGEEASRVDRALRLVQTTSPSYLLMASLDAARQQLQQSGDRWERTAGLGLRLRREISRIPGLLAPGEELLEVPGVCAYDPARLVVNVRGLGITGLTAGKWLAGERRLLAEMADLDNLVFILGPGDEGPVAEALLDSLRDLASACGSAECGSNRSSAGGGRRAGDPGASGQGAFLVADLYRLPIPCQILTPRQAFFAPQCQVPLEAAVGKVAAGIIAPYPPGVPLICPGEAIDKPVLECLQALRQAGATWPGQAGGTICVVDGS